MLHYFVLRAVLGPKAEIDYVDLNPVHGQVSIASKKKQKH